MPEWIFTTKIVKALTTRSYECVSSHPEKGIAEIKDEMRKELLDMITKDFDNLSDFQNNGKGIELFVDIRVTEKQHDALMNSSIMFKK